MKKQVTIGIVCISIIAILSISGCVQEVQDKPKSGENFTFDGKEGIYTSTEDIYKGSKCCDKVIWTEGVLSKKDDWGYFLDPSAPVFLSEDFEKESDYIIGYELPKEVDSYVGRDIRVYGICNCAGTNGIRIADVYAKKDKEYSIIYSSKSAWGDLTKEKAIEEWRKWIENHGVSKKYFEDHIKINKVTLFHGDTAYGKYELWELDYQYHVDWFNKNLNTNMKIWDSANGEKHYFTAQERIEDLDTVYKKPREITNIMSKREAINKLKKECSQLLEFCEDDSCLETEYGTLTLQGFGTILLEENKCIFGRIGLENGQVECWETQCLID